MTTQFGPGLPEAVARVARPVNERLQMLVDTEVRRWSVVDPGLETALSALGRYMLAGGKRLRPAFCYWAFVGAGGDPDDPAVIEAGAALELVHTAALIHDDVIDGSRRRHGVDTLHVSFSDRHRRQRWIGHPDRFGEGVAIIAGDLALVYSSRLMADAPAAAREVFEDMRLEVNIGQYLDVLAGAEGIGGRPERAEARARRVVRYKTAKYTVERPLQLGTALAAADRATDLSLALSAFAIPLGEAFQLKDDLLGVFGDPQATGKPVGDDLREGKPTVLACLAAAGLDEPARSRFTTLLSAPERSDTDVEELRGAMVASGAGARVEGEVERLATQAEAALGDVKMRPEARDALRELARYVAGRDR